MKTSIIVGLALLAMCSSATAGPLGIFRWRMYDRGYEPGYYYTPTATEFVSPCCCDIPQQLPQQIDAPATLPTEFAEPTATELEWLRLERMRRNGERQDGRFNGQERRSNERNQLPRALPK